MIITGSRLHVVDNSGARKVRCLKVYGVQPKGHGGVGATILVSVRSLSPKIQNPKVRVGSMYKAVIVNTLKSRQRADGSSLAHGYNACVLLNAQGGPLGTRVHTHVGVELRREHTKILSLAPRSV